MFVRVGELASVEPLVDKACWFLSLSEGDLTTLSLGKAAREWINLEIWPSLTGQIYNPKANVADHSVSAREKLHESEANWAWCFISTMLPQKSLASSTIWCVLFCYACEFLCS